VLDHRLEVGQPQLEVVGDVAVGQSMPRSSKR
jgi:hypothetical protein